MNVRSALRVWLLGFALLPALAGAGLPPDLESRVRAIVEEERERAGIPALSVAVFTEDGVVALFATGEADVEAKLAATTETLFPAASVTKTLTAALVMQGVERGQLSLDAPVNESLPSERQVRDAAGVPVAVTLRQLLSHSSGLPVSWAGIQDDPNEPPRSLDDLLAHGLRTVRAPGEKLIYANDAFALAGWIAARAEGVSFDELARKGLFEPLRMTHSSLVPPREAGPALAAAYGRGGLFRGGERVSHQTVSGTAPAGALITTAEDLARFGTALLRGGELDGARVLAPESVAEMMRLQARADPRLPEGFGLGFGVREIPGRKLVWWDGSLAGAASRLALLPDQGVGVAILSNLANNEPVSIAARRTLELLVPPTPAADVRSAQRRNARRARRHVPATRHGGPVVRFPRVAREPAARGDGRWTRAVDPSLAQPRAPRARARGPVPGRGNDARRQLCARYAGTIADRLRRSRAHSGLAECARAVRLCGTRGDRADLHGRLVWGALASPAARYVS